MVWEVENGRAGVLVVEMAMPFAWVEVGARQFFSWEVEKESISSVWEESIFSGKASAAVEVEKESFVEVVVWEISAAEEEGPEKETDAFGQVVGRDSSSFYHF